MVQTNGVGTYGYVGGRRRKTSPILKPFRVSQETALTLFWLIGLSGTLVAFIRYGIEKENKDCGRPSPILHGYMLTEESKAKVFCSVGYTSSSSEVLCQGNGNWSSVYCYKIDCGKTLPLIEFGHLTLNKEQDSTYRAVATVKCSVGYHSDKVKVVCQENGRWESNKCLPVDCGKTLPLIEFGHLTLNKEQDSTYRAVATVKCSVGYHSDKVKVVCQENGRWESIKCLPVDCGKTLPLIEFGHLTLNKEQDSTYGAVATVKCSDGYNSDNETVGCQENGRWEEANCLAVDCGESLPSIEFGHLSLNKKQHSTYGAMATVKCSTGYHSDKVTVVCQENGRWEKTKCLPVDCGESLPSIEFGHLTLNKEQNSTYGAMATVKCSDGYHSHKVKVVCQENGRWEKTICLPVDCGETLPSIEFGHLVLNKEQKSTYGAMATVKCSSGYHSYKVKVVCQENGRWEKTTCLPVDCGETLPSIEFGHLSLNKEKNSTYGAMATVKCSSGYHSYKVKVVCQENGRWEKTTCLPVDCGENLPPIEFGHLVLNKGQNSTYSAMATVKCSGGYYSDKVKVVCQENGRWEMTRCLPVECGKSLPSVEFGHLALDKEQKSTYGAMATVQCSGGYYSDKVKVVCQENGRWESIKCLPVDCGESLPSLDFGYMILNKWQISTYNGFATVMCFPGYHRNKVKVFCQENGRWEEAKCLPISK